WTDDSVVPAGRLADLLRVAGYGRRLADLVLADRLEARGASARDDPRGAREGVLVRRVVRNVLARLAEQHGLCGQRDSERPARGAVRARVFPNVAARARGGSFRLTAGTLARGTARDALAAALEDRTPRRVVRSSPRDDLVERAAAADANVVVVETTTS